MNIDHLQDNLPTAMLIVFGEASVSIFGGIRRIHFAKNYYADRMDLTTENANSCSIERSRLPGGGSGEMFRVWGKREIRKIRRRPCSIMTHPNTSRSRVIWAISPAYGRASLLILEREINHSTDVSDFIVVSGESAAAASLSLVKQPPPPNFVRSRGGWGGGGPGHF